MSVPPSSVPGPSGPAAPTAEHSRTGTHRLDQDDVAAMLVGRYREFSRTDVSRLAGVSLVGARKFWHALGFPITGGQERSFTEADLRALRRIGLLVRSGVLDEETALALTRAFARTADRLTAWQVQLIADSVNGRPTDPLPHVGPEPVESPADAPELDEDTTQAVARRVLDLADELESMLVYAWRRHLTDAVARMLADAPPGAENYGVVRVIGFADLVSFSTRVSQLTERQIARLVERFEALAADIVTAHGGRVVKTVGDEVLFSCTDPAPGAAIALDLVEALEEDSIMPDARVGCAYGPVLARMGDVFGTTVNRAARLTPLAHPGAVLIDGQLAAALTSQSGFDVTPTRKRLLRGVGTVQPHVLVRSSTPTRRGRYP
ncbi:MAG: adenylate/guanylate cyclase domain-containing protein [Actinomycetales bacterium]|nr:MAG: adenylate/guanylate cyclase domain-containing protein [Actinomycetales bacterium]